MTHPHNLFPKVFQPSTSRTFSSHPSCVSAPFSPSHPSHLNTRHINNKQFPLLQHHRDAQRQHPKTEKCQSVHVQDASTAGGITSFSGVSARCITRHRINPNPTCLCLCARSNHKNNNSQTEKSSALLHNWAFFFFPPTCTKAQAEQSGKRTT